MNSRTRLGTTIGTTVAFVATLTLLGAPAALAADGAETPEALMEKLRKSAEDKDTAAVVSAILPEERSFLAFMIGMFGVELTGAMITGRISSATNQLC